MFCTSQEIGWVDRLRNDLSNICRAGRTLNRTQHNHIVMLTVHVDCV